MISTRHLGALTLVLLLLSGCGALDLGAGMEQMPSPSTATDTTSESDPAAESEPTETESTESDESTPSRPDLAGLREVTVEGVGLRLGVPRDWLTVDEDVIAEETNLEGLQAAADAMGIDVEALKAGLPGIELLVIDGVGNNVNVVDAQVLSELPTAAAVRTQYEMVNAHVTRIRTVDTPAGAARVGYYAIEIAGEARYGAGAFVRLSTGVVVVTFTAFDKSTRDELVKKVLPTLDESGAPGEA